MISLWKCEPSYDVISRKFQSQKFIISLKKLNLWHTSYFSWTKILWIACFWKKVRLRIKQLSWLDALLYKINRHHCNSILHCSSSFIWRQCSLWITGHQITYLQRNRKKSDQYFDPHSGNISLLSWVRLSECSFIVS